MIRHPFRVCYNTGEFIGVVPGEPVKLTAGRCVSIMASREPKLTKAESVYRSLREQILSSELPPGAHVSERSLAERLEVGKAPVRVAIQRLATEGFLTIEPRRGVRVVESTLQDTLELFQVRTLMEQLIVRRIAGRLKSDQIDRLHENMRQARNAASVLDLDAMIQSDFEFHRQMADFHGNYQLGLMLRRILDRLHREVRYSVTTTQRAQKRLEEHQRIVNALIEGDAQAAEDELVRHLQIGEQYIRSPDGPPGSTGSGTPGHLTQSL